MGYRIFTDSTADVSPEQLEKLTQVTYIPMDITLGDQAYTYGPGGNITAKEFYAAQRAGKFASTSQINPDTYLHCFEESLAKGEDVLYLCFSSGLSGTYQTACLCVDDLKQKYPERKIVCIDTLCASVGEGLVVWEAARLQEKGLSLDEVAQWVMDHRLDMCHWFTVDTFEHLKHGGRVSAATAAVGSLLQIKPMLRVSETGELGVAEKPRGAKNAVKAQMNRFRKDWMPEVSPAVLVGHGDCLDRAQELRDMVLAEFPNAEIYIGDIGPVIGAHTGPGMLALVFWGRNR